MADDDRAELARQAAELADLDDHVRRVSLLSFITAVGLILVILALRAKGIVTGSLLSEAFAEAPRG